MNWKQIITDLNDLGMTKSEIARLCGVSQPRITALLRGNSTVTYEVGDKLLSIWKIKKATNGKAH